jgi:hypothetical protein
MKRRWTTQRRNAKPHRRKTVLLFPTTGEQSEQPGWEVVSQEAPFGAEQRAKIKQTCGSRYRFVFSLEIWVIRRKATSLPTGQKRLRTTLSG